MLLNEKQVQILKAIADGHINEEQLVNTLDWPSETIRDYLRSLKELKFIDPIEGLHRFKTGHLTFVKIRLTDKGKVAVNNPDDLLMENIPPKNDFRGSKFYGAAFDSPKSAIASGETVQNNSILGTQHNYSPEEEQSLVESVQEIKALIEELKQTYPTTTLNFLNFGDF